MLRFMSVRIIGGKLGGRRLRGEGKGLRPTTGRVRAAIFSILGDSVAGARVLDLFAGTGALGIEALSRGAASADFVEVDRRRADQIARSLEDLGLGEIGEVYRGRVERMLGRLPGGYDVVLIGAPYDLKTWDELLEEIGEAGVAGPRGVVVAEYRYGTELKERYGALARRGSKRYGDTGVSVYHRE